MFVGYFIVKEQQWYQLTYNWEGRGFRTFSRVLIRKKIAKLEIELTSKKQSDILVNTPRGLIFWFFLYPPLRYTHMVLIFFFWRIIFLLIRFLFFFFSLASYTFYKVESGVLKGLQRTILLCPYRVNAAVKL